MRTLVKLPISRAAHNEIAELLRAVDCNQFFVTGGGLVLEGIALVIDPDREVPPGIVIVDAADINRDAFREIYQLENLGNGDNEA